MVHTGLNEKLKYGILPICAAIATKLENIMVKPHEQNCAHDDFYSKIPYNIKHFRSLGEMGVVCSIVSVKVKIEDQGMTCMLLGYAQNHTSGT